MSYSDKSIDNKAVGNRIRSIRLEKGQTMEEFGEQLATSKGTVNNWEKGRNLPNKENLKAIAEIGNIIVAELLYGTIDEIVKSGIEDTLANSVITPSKEEYKELFRLVSKELLEYPYRYHNNEDVRALAKSITNAYLSNFEKNDFNVLNYLIDTIYKLDVDYLEKSYFDITYSEKENLIFDYYELSFKSYRISSKTFKSNMDKDLYENIKSILFDTQDELNDLFIKKFKTRRNTTTDAIRLMILLINNLIDTIFKKLPNELQKEENIKHIETYILAHAKSIFIKAFGTDQPIEILEKYDPKKDIDFEVDIERMIATLKNEEALEITYIDSSGNLKKKYI